MKSKERVAQTLKFKEPDRAPFNFWMDRRLMEKYEDKFGEDFRINHYGVDVIETFPLLEWPQGKGEIRDGSFWIREPRLEDWDDVDSLELPDPEDDKVYENISRTLKKYPDKAVFVNIPGPFTVLHNIRMMDNLYFDVYDHPEELHLLIAKIMDIQNEVISRVVNWPITAIYFQDDVATSNGLMFSLSMIKDFIMDYFKPGINRAQQEDKFVVFHSDGDVTDVLDTLVEMGIDAVNPMQPEFNNFSEFKQKYHGQLAVYGALDNTKIIPDGTEEDIITHVNETFEVLGENGGLIFSTHDIPLHCPQKNLDIMVSAIKDCIYS